MLQGLMLFFVLPVTGFAMLLTFLRIVRGPSIADRVLALDMLLIIGIAVIAAYSIGMNQTAFLDIAVLLALLGFLSTVAFAYYIERRI